MLWILLTAVAEPGAGVDLPPATDTSGRLMVMAGMLGPPLFLMITGLVNAKKPKSNGPLLQTPLAGGNSPTPRLDVQDEYLQKFVKLLEDSEKDARKQLVETEQKWQRKYEALEQKYLELIQKYASVAAQYEALREVVVRGRIQGHEND